MQHNDPPETGDQPARLDLTDLGGAVLRGKRILVVEDEVLIAIDLIDQLTDLGACCVGPALTLEQALQLAQFELDCAVLDIRVGPDDVSPVARLLWERGIGFVFHSGDANESALGEQWPGCRVLKKPADPESLIAAVKSALRMRT